MPLYEYHCKSCNQITEIMQKFSDAPLTTCEKCAGPVEKIISRSSFQLKGSGWYASDYKKSTAPAPTESAASATKESSDTKSGCGSGPGCQIKH